MNKYIGNWRRRQREMLKIQKETVDGVRGRSSDGRLLSRDCTLINIWNKIMEVMMVPSEAGLIYSRFSAATVFLSSVFLGEVAFLAASVGLAVVVVVVVAAVAAVAALVTSSATAVVDSSFVTSSTTVVAAAAAAASMALTLFL